MWGGGLGSFLWGGEGGAYIEDLTGMRQPSE